jgi:hypothetical protein
VETTTLSYAILPVVRLEAVEGGLAITFGNGSAGFLAADHPNFAVVRIHAEAGCRRPFPPVGCLLDADGRILDLCSAHDTGVRSVRDCPADPSRCEVSFWAYSPVCALARDHPEFERIYSTLTEAVKTSHMVWVAPHSQEVVGGEPDEDGLIPTYPKIMDVRPA